MSGCIAVINAGSSSVKFALYDADADVSMRFRGQVEGIGIAPHLKISNATGDVVTERNWPAAGFDHDAATRELLDDGVRPARGSTGGRHRAPCCAWRDAICRARPPGSHVLASLEKLIPLAPLASAA